ncbi:hypothetical protein DMA11_06770 [Marinilabiliaceae bacterium JC017]|nr:hypothetical protein DMA11_06770 [Marinilabiliaceae bacterium JC017]
MPIPIIALQMNRINSEGVPVTAQGFNPVFPIIVIRKAEGLVCIIWYQDNTNTPSWLDLKTAIVIGLKPYAFTNGLSALDAVTLHFPVSAVSFQ